MGPGDGALPQLKVPATLHAQIVGAQCPGRNPGPGHCWGFPGTLSPSLRPYVGLGRVAGGTPERPGCLGAEGTLGTPQGTEVGGQPKSESCLHPTEQRQVWGGRGASVG